MKTFATLFSGFGGADIGAIEAGLTPIWAVEYEADIAAVYRDNLGDHVTVADILTLDPANFARPDILHASPPCPNFSNAKAGGEETEQDIALAEKVAEFVTVLLPDFFTLENVYQYRESKSWETIARALMTHGYSFNYWHVCTADYGVPQTRRRMIVIARKDGKRPQLPPATHAEKPEVGLFRTLKPWIGWYEAIEDLIPGLPDSEFANWQLERLPRELAGYLTDLSNATRDFTQREYHEPATTVTSSAMRRPSTIPKAYIVDGRNSNQEWGKLYRDENEPSTSVTVLNRPAHFPRAFIVDGKLSTGGNEKKLQINGQETPAGTVFSSHSAFRDARAFVMSNQRSETKNGMIPVIRMQDEPVTTVRTGKGGFSNSFVNGRVVQMTPRALARFQSFPDWYELPESKRLACRGIGNAVPPLFMQRLCESLK